MPRKKPTDARNEPGGVRLTATQRQTLLGTSLPNPLRERIESAGKGTAPVAFSSQELIQAATAVLERMQDAETALRNRLATVYHRFVEQIMDPAGDARRTTVEWPQDRSQAVFQFRILLACAFPPVWRRIQMRDGTLEDLHDMIQASMGWENAHLHQFRIGKLLYVMEMDDGFDSFMETRSETETRLSELVSPGQAEEWEYEYDFGDGWRHFIQFEGFAPSAAAAKLPRCIGGARACPPEDIGGLWGYFELLDFLEHPEEAEDGERWEWLRNFDPEAFDPSEATRSMQKSRRSRRSR